jgi:chorismate synthase/very-short-patch-repair endonuclease
MNSFGRLFRVTIFGESHGPSVGITIDGCPAGLPLSEADFLEDLERRKGGLQKGTTPRKEDDKPIFVSGLFNGKTTGAPLTILFENNNTRSSDYEKQRAIPRPGHADFVAHKKFSGFEDYRGGGHFSGRLTVCLVAAGVIAKKVLDLTPSPSPKERGAEPGYLTTSPEQWKNISQFAKQNRHHPTEAETILWEELRNRKIEDCKFRRQHPIEGYIPDFVCLDKQLVVEVDGGYHSTQEQLELDAYRSKILNRNGYEVLRFSNDDVLNNLSAVLLQIKEKLQNRSTEHNSPLPGRGAGGEVLDKKIKITASILEIAGEKNIDTGLQKAIDAKDSVGGLVECRVEGLPIGLGEPFFDSVESLLAHAAFSIPAVKGIEFGAGFAAARMFGSQHNDALLTTEGITRTNHAGGVVGGLSTGNELVFRVAIKPTSSTPKDQESLNLETGAVEQFSIKGRHDLCIALRVPPVLEAVTAMVLADLMFISGYRPQPV